MSRTTGVVVRVDLSFQDLGLQVTKTLDSPPSILDQAGKETEADEERTAETERFPTPETVMTSIVGPTARTSVGLVPMFHHAGSRIGASV